MVMEQERLGLLERATEALGPDAAVTLMTRGELVTAITSQTRSLLLGMIGSGLSMGGLVLAAARVL